MKKIFISWIVLGFILAACAPKQPTEEPSLIIDEPIGRPTPQKPTPTTPPVRATDPIEQAVIKQLAGNLGLNVKDISVVSNKSVEFPDACLGVSMPDLMCAQVITTGRIILLKAKDVQYEYHTSADGSRVQPVTLALTWKREGGIAGFCDNLTVFLSGEVYGNQCKTQDGRMGTFVSLLSAGERKQFDSWTTRYGEVELDASDPKGVADGMTVLLSLYGNGTTQPSKNDEAALFLWAQNTYQRLYK